MYYFNFVFFLGGGVAKAKACLGLSRSDHNYQPHKRDVVISSRGASENTCSIFPESMTAIQGHFLVSAKGSVTWEVVYYRLTTILGKLNVSPL